MRLYKKDNINNYVYFGDLSISAIGLLNSLLVKSNDELKDFNIYSICMDSRKNIFIAFKELKNKKYIIYDESDETYYVYVTPQNN